MFRFAAALGAVPFLALTACSSGGGPQASAPIVPVAAPGQTMTAATGSRAALQARMRSAAATLDSRPSSPRRTAFDAASAVGTSNTTTADPPVPRPPTTPCVVPLFSGVQFADFSPKPFQFAPPAACPGPWSKVVFELNLGVSAGRQFDRTAVVGLGGTTIFFGTTSEPSATVARSWHVERDLTDESALFKTAQTGQISIGNVVNSTYTGVLDGAAQLDFYPASERAPAPRVADVVVPIADPAGNPQIVQTTTDTAATSFVPPRTIERAELDVIAQSQSADEFWYTCFPNDLATLLNNCGNTAFRETEVAVDGKPAGAAPVYPWIYTGGIDPYLWRPIPGVQTLDFVPYRVDLTPFAGALDDGNTHAVALSVYNADHYFSVTGTLLLYLDRGARGPLSGALDADDASLTPPESVVEGGSFSASGVGTGTIDTTSRRSLHLRGHVTTSHGTIATDVAQTLAFVQHQAVTSSATSFVQNITQETTIDATSRANVSRERERGRDGDEHGGEGFGETETTFDWPLTLDYAFVVNADGTQAQTTTVDQRYLTKRVGAFGVPLGTIQDVVTSADTLTFDATGAFTGTSNNASAQTFRAAGGAYGCYGRKVASINGVVTSDAPTSCFGDDAPHR